MSSMNEPINQALSATTISQISQTIGADKKATETAISGALPVYTSGLAEALGSERRSAQKAAPDAMKVFSDLLDTDGDGQVMDNVAQIGTSLLGTFLGSRR